MFPSPLKKYMPPAIHAALPVGHAVCSISTEASTFLRDSLSYCDVLSNSCGG